MSSRMKMVLGGAFIVIAFFAYQYFGTASISISSVPEGAKVSIDGQLRGLTPIEGIEVSSGRHLLEVSHSFYAPAKENIRLSRGDHLTRAIDFKTGKGTFEFLSNPRGAWVEVDGKRISGRTPFKYEYESGPHEIVMGDEERRTSKQVVVLNHSELKQVNFTLNIDPHGTVTFSLSPRNAKVEFVGTNVSYRPKIRIPIGEYPVRVSRPGFVAQEFRYKVRYGNNLKNVSLKREYADIRVQAKPKNAQVSIIYNAGGRKTTKPYGGVLRVPTGQVQVRARAMGYRTRIKNIRLGSKGATVKFDLKPMTIKAGEAFSDKLRSGSVGPEMIVVPAGQFKMGNKDGPISENPVRTVFLTQPFAVSKHEVTIGDFLEYSRNSAINVEHKMMMGGYSSKLISFDLKDADLSENIMSSAAAFGSEPPVGSQDYLSMSGEELPDLGVYSQIPTKTSYLVLDTGVQPGGTTDEQLDKSKEENFDTAGIYNQSVMRYNQLFASTITLTIAGDFSLHAGDALFVDIATLKADTKGDDINEKDGGVYIISDLTHYISKKETYTKMNLVRDSTGRKGNHAFRKGTNAHTVMQDNFLPNIK